jgi:hypothetical protein
MKIPKNASMNSEPKICPSVAVKTCAFLHLDFFLLMSMALPWIVRKAIDFDVWFNERVLGWSKDRNFKWVLSGARDEETREYIRLKFSR